MMKVYILCLSIAGLILCSWYSLNKGNRENSASYVVESIEMPDGLTAETGAIDFLPDGRLVACFLRGEVMLYDPVTKKWNVFAEGLHEPLGILVINKSEFIVMQRPELTRIKDTDGDGRADLYETVTDEFGITGNFHEFNYGPLRDKDGSLFVAFNLASANGAIRPEVRGRLDTSGRRKGKEMFSVVPHRGWIMKLTTDGKLLPYAMGLRSPNGLCFDPDGNLLVSDNQGDWKGTSTLYHVQEGKFYGHPAGMIWNKGWDKGSPFDIPVSALDSMRTKGAVLFPQGIMANSPSQPLCDMTEGKFGPFKGQLFIGEMNSERIMRVMLEKVDGELQGACIPFIDGKGLRKGNNRLAFAPDGSLWVGQAAYGWTGNNGIQRIHFTGKQPMDIYSMNLTDKGFDLTFTQPVNETFATNLNNYKFRRYYYNYHRQYGSDQMDITHIPVKKIDISADQKSVSLTLSSLKPGYVYELNLENIKASSGDSLANKLVCYTVNRLKK